MRILECGSKPGVPSATRASEQCVFDEKQSNTWHRGTSYARAMTRSRFAEEGGVFAALQCEHKGQRTVPAKTSTEASDIFSSPLFWF